MIEVEIPKDINGYKPKFIGPLTLRNTVSIIITAITAVPIGFLLGQVFVNEIALTIAMIIGAPILFCVFKDIYGMPAEKFILMYLKTQVFTPKDRKYKTNNFYQSFLPIQDKKLNDKELKKYKKKVKKNKKKEKRKNKINALYTPYFKVFS